jgi:RNA polymerase sigma-70 factor (ECF subfamily)
VAETTLTQLEALDDESAAIDMPFAMDEDAFRAFYDRTAPALWAYLSRLSGDRQLADDLLQESYYRLLRSRESFEGEAHRRNYLFRIATNLVNDSRRGRFAAWRTVPLPELSAEGGSPEARADVQRALARLKPRERALLWLAYAQGSSHSEIAGVLGVKTGSIKLLLFRARRKMAALLTKAPEKGGQG